MSDLLCFGEPMIEMNQQPSGQYLSGFGGDTSNCAIAAARAGASVGVIGAIGADPFGDSFIQLWKDEGVHTDAMQQSTLAPTGLYFVHHDQDGHHFSYYRKGSASSQIMPHDVPTAAIQQAKIVHISGISVAISESACDAAYRAIAIAKEVGVKLSFDTNLRLKLWPLARARAVINDIAGLSDYLLPGLDDAIALTGLTRPEDIIDYYHQLGAKNIALTLGKDGVMLSDGTTCTTIQGRIVEAVDATGAGDTFDGNFLARILAGDSLTQAAIYANAAASLGVQGFGAVEPMPYSQDVQAILHTSTL